MTLTNLKKRIKTVVAINFIISAKIDAFSSMHHRLQTSQIQSSVGNFFQHINTNKEAPILSHFHRHIGKTYRPHQRVNSKLYLGGDFFSDHYFMLNGIVTGIILSVGTSVNRNVQADQAWEARIKEAQVKARQAQGDGLTVSELDLRAELAEMSPSMYGPEAMDRRRRKKQNEDDDLNDEDELSPEEILEFEKMYGVKYDPYYDQAYYEDELPIDMDFSVDSYFGDRVYENGETFFKDGEKYYRKGSKPRLKFFSWNKS